MDNIIQELQVALCSPPEDWAKSSTEFKQGLLDRAEEELSKGVQVDVETTSVFAGGMCARTGTLPAGMVFIGAVHLQPQLQIVHSGKVRILDIDGVRDVTGLEVFGSEGMNRRLCVVVEEVTWTTIIRTDETTEDKVWETCTKRNFNELHGIDKCTSSLE